jgi:outer membrane receptor protein involved in Fe transport
VSARRAGSLRTSYFWTEVNRPITALLISETSSSIIEMRENLGQLRSRGVSVEYEATPTAWLHANAGYQYAKATVTAFAPEPALVGLWIPEVPRNMFSGNVRLDPHGFGTLQFFAYVSGRQYDDSQNEYLLHGYARFDVEYSHTLTHHWDAYVSVQNLLDRTIEVARTPVLSVGAPQLLVVGIRRVGWKDGR